MNQIAKYQYYLFLLFLFQNIFSQSENLENYDFSPLLIIILRVQ